MEVRSELALNILSLVVVYLDSGEVERLPSGSSSSFVNAAQAGLTSKVNNVDVQWL